MLLHWTRLLQQQLRMETHQQQQASRSVLKGWCDSFGHLLFLSLYFSGQVAQDIVQSDTIDAQAGGTWGSSSGLGWAISSIGLARPATQGSIGSAAGGAAAVPSSLAAPAAARAAGSGAALQAMLPRHDNGPSQNPGRPACPISVCKNALISNGKA